MVSNKNCFVFLKDEFEDIYNRCSEVENYIRNHDYKTALQKSRITIELVVNKIFVKEQINFGKDLNENIRILSSKHIISNNITRDYNRIKHLGNVFSHPDEMPGRYGKNEDIFPQEDSL